MLLEGIFEAVFTRVMESPASEQDLASEPAIRDYLSDLSTGDSHDYLANVLSELTRKEIIELCQ